MHLVGAVEAFDVAVRTGVCSGYPGQRPSSLTVRLKRPDEPPDVALANLLAFLVERWAEDRPKLVVKEAPIAIGARISNADTVRITLGLHAILEATARRFGIPWVEAADSTIRKHFLGVGRLGDRSSTKAAVIHRCHVLRYLPLDCRDDNRADACAAWDWGCAHKMRKPPKMLHLFGEKA